MTFEPGKYYTNGVHKILFVGVSAGGLLVFEFGDGELRKYVKGDVQISHWAEYVEPQEIECKCYIDFYLDVDKKSVPVIRSGTEISNFVNWKFIGTIKIDQVYAYPK